MLKKKPFIIAIILLVIVIAGTGCTAKLPEPDYYIWPQFPNEVRIVYLATYYGREDVKKSTFVDTILGKPTAYDFQKPYGVYADQERIYITETNDPSLVILNVLKGKADFIQGADFGRFLTPIGVVASQKGNIYVSDAKLGGVYIFDKEGEYLSMLGKRGAFQRPTGMAVDNKLQRLYIADAKADTVHVYSFAGDLLFSFGKPGAGPGGLHGPTNLAVDRRNGT
jgi:hypothetical protein